MGIEAFKESRILVTMNITIRKIDEQESPRTRSFSRKSPVNSRLVLGIENEKLTYTIVPVEPYEREYAVEDTDYGFEDPNVPSFSLKWTETWLAGSK